MADDKVMSQAEIDALVAKVPVKPNVPKPAQATTASKSVPPPPPPKPPVAEKPAAPPPAPAVPKPAPPPPPPKPPVAEKPAVPPPTPAVPKPAPPPPPSKPPAAEKPAVTAPVATAPKPPAAAVPPAPPPAPREGGAKYERYSSGEVGNLQTIVADLARQVGKMTNAMQKLESMEEKVNMISSLLKLEPGDTQSLGARLDEIYARLDAIQKASIQNEFVCNHCKTSQTLALHIKCTTCGEETWMGWWPEGNHK